MTDEKKGVTLDRAAWQAGHAAGLAGNKDLAPLGVDALAFYAGLIEGQAERKKPHPQAKTAPERFTLGDLYRLDNLSRQAEELAGALLVRMNRAPLHSPEFDRLKRIEAKAHDRAERRYKKSLKAWKASPNP